MRKKKKTLFFEILVIATVVFAFMTAACIDKRSMADEHLLAYGVTLAADILIFAGWIGLVYHNWYRFWTKRKKTGGFENESCGIMITLAFCFATRAFQLSDTPRWDGLTYYNMLLQACQNFDFSLKTFQQNFSLANHPTLGFAGITAIGEFLNSGGYMGVLIVWMGVTLLTAFCVYRILERILAACSWVYHTFAACVVMSAPLVLGTFSYYQPDAGAVCFFVFTVYCYMYRKHLLMFFSMLLLLLTKEIGVVILCGFGLGALLGRVFFTGKEETAGKRFVQFFKEPLGICGLLAVCGLGIYLIIFLMNGGRIWSISDSNIEGFSTVSFQPSFIAYKCKQFFVLNFNWLIWGGNLILFLTAKIRHALGKKPFAKQKRKDLILAVFLAAFAQMVFYSIYITYALPRYHVLIDFCGVFLFFVFLPVCLPKGAMRYAAAGATGVLLLLEAYTTIDPVSLAAFRTIDTGMCKIINESKGVGAIQRDFCVYNHQYTYMNKAYDHVLKDVGYHEGMDVVIWNSVVNDEVWDSRIVWDMEKQKRTLQKGENTISIRGIIREDIEQGNESLQSEAVFVLTPQFIISEEDAERFLKKYYDIRYKGYVEIPFGGKVTFYVCDLVRQIGAQE